MKNNKKLIEFLQSTARNDEGIFFVPYYEMDEFTELVKGFISTNHHIEGVAQKNAFAFRIEPILEFYDITNEEIA